MNNEEKEYKEFWEDVIKKALEVDKKYQNLSSLNKYKIQQETNKLFEFKNVTEAVNEIKNKFVR